MKPGPTFRNRTGSRPSVAILAVCCSGHLQAFVEVSRTGNLSRAVDALDMSESTVTARMHALEKELGQTFFSCTDVVRWSKNPGATPHAAFATRSLVAV